MELFVPPVLRTIRPGVAVVELKRRVLFVDDEPRILSGLSRMLFGLRKDWDIGFANSADEAMAAMARDPYDVVVSDMRMPEMDGAELLTRIRDRYPHAVRIILSGHTEKEATFRALPVAHQFLSKPCDADTIKQTIDRALAIRDLVTNEGVREVVGLIGTLPSAPSIYLRLTEVLQDEHAGVDSIGALIEQDAALAGKVLHMVNTAFFGRPRSTTDVSTAVSLLGTSTLRDLVLGAEVFAAFRFDEQPGFSVGGEMRHATIVARLAKQLAPAASWRDEAFTAGLLHDMGKLILATYLPEPFADVRSQCAASGRPLHEGELLAFGTTHAAVGAYLLGLWGIPRAIVEAVALHHDGKLFAKDQWDAAVTVHVADRMVHAHDEALGGAEWTLDDLDWLGRQEEYAQWRELVATAVAEVDSAATERRVEGPENP